LNIDIVILTTVNYVGNCLIFKNGIFFELLIKCFFILDSKLNKGNRNIISTQLTGNIHNH